MTVRYSKLANTDERLLIFGMPSRTMTRRCNIKVPRAQKIGLKSTYLKI